jgi:hypothetical protein
MSDSRKFPGTPAILSTPPAARAGGTGDFRIDMALRQIGFAPGQALPPQKSAGGKPAPAAAAQPDARTARALARRDWLLDVMERQRALSRQASGIARVRDLSSEAFLDHFYAPGRPVIIEGAMAGWPALERWTPEYLRAAVGEAVVEYQSGRSRNPEFELQKDRHKKRAPFSRFMELIEGGQGNDAYITAYNSGSNAAALAPLHADLGTLDRYLTPASGMLWIGPGGTFTPLHFDLTNNLLAQVVGRKRVILLPPSQTHRLHHHRHVFSAVHDIEDEAQLQAHPSARQARTYAVDLAPGDLLYIPIGWWHQVRAADFSAMLTYTNFLWPNEGFAEYPAD